MAAIMICSDLEVQKMKSVTVSTVSPSMCHEVMGPDAMILVFQSYKVYHICILLYSFTYLDIVF